ncbi:hypothetical protein H1P_1180020 [Hyella patelloides LEGE 07179]|uniref:Uncharacterized protein n=1 Tax=Hyella patelloides LEGE 07179 TaxID=945734 RepID=A0A563VJZ3_9CYAN|nr:hypothetical protein H1P_1180020 [Hyella patelloides LEGE 07179]
MKRNDLKLPFQYSWDTALKIYRKRIEFTLTIAGLFLVWYFVFLIIYFLFFK